MSGPGLGEFGGGEVAVGAVGSVDVVVDAPVLDERLYFEEAVELPSVEHPSRSRLLNNSIQAFCHGEPRSMKMLPTPLNRHQSATAWSQWLLDRPSRATRSGRGRIRSALLRAVSRTAYHQPSLTEREFESDPGHDE